MSEGTAVEVPEGASDGVPKSVAVGVLEGVGRSDAKKIFLKTLKKI